MTPKVTWSQALAWRMERQLLEPVGSLSVPRVVRRLCAVQAQVASSAELAVRVRRRSSKSGEVARALSDGRLIKTWAMRGTLHLLTPEDAGIYLSLIASGRSWERPSWQKYFGVSPRQIEQLRSVVREELTG
ncbi:MAG TPA: crosslink repair DNA glycosylase YcaQ family protein, partial [Actinomycetota bacterium]